MRAWHRKAASVACFVWLGACSSLPAGGKGDTCERSAQCAERLACVQHKCSNDLKAIADQNMVPDLGNGSEAGVESAADGAVLDDAGNGSVTDGGPIGGASDAASAADTGTTPGTGQDASGSDDDAG
jgi:hypothetical protein